MTIHTTNAKSPINFQVNLLKAPSNFGYYSSRVNRLYNEDRWQSSILDLHSAALRPHDDGGNGPGKIEIESLEGFTFDNERLINETKRTCEPTYQPRSPPIDRTVFAFGVFDGHGGDECSAYIRNHLFENIENLNISKRAISDVKKFWNSKISGYWKRWGRQIGAVIIKECNIEIVVKQYLDEINKRHRDALGAQGEINNERQSKREESPAEDDESKETDDEMDEHNLIDWEDFKSGKKFWDVIEMMMGENRLSHWEILKLRIWIGYLLTDIQFLTYENECNKEIKVKSKNRDPQDVAHKLINSGSTCTSIFLYPNEWKDNDTNRYFYQDNVLSRLVVAHVGDTRAILCDKNGLAHSLTKDHHPSNPTESNRLRKLSSGLIMTDSFGEERYLNFANTRSFGDISAKNVGITAEPEISDYLIGNSHMLETFKNDPAGQLIIANNKVRDFGGDESFIVLVSDGVTNYLSDQEIVDLIMTNFNNRGVNKGSPSKCAEEVIGFVECIGGDDNATCLVVRLGGWGRWPIQDRTGKLREERMMDTRYNAR